MLGGNSEVILKSGRRVVGEVSLSTNLSGLSARVTARNQAGCVARGWAETSEVAP